MGRGGSGTTVRASPSSTFVPAVGTTSTTAASRTIEITEGDPNSCRMRIEHTDRWKRGDWDCTIRYGADLTSTPTEFHLQEWVIAKKGEVEIFRREIPSVIERDLL